MDKYYIDKKLISGVSLGAIYPFIIKEKPNNFFFNMNDVINSRITSNLDVKLDRVGLVEKACLPYLLGNRTLLENVERTPWMSSYKSEQWVGHKPPEHGKQKPDTDVFILKLKNELIKEAADYVGNASTVGILLSGGMDSRVVAGVIRQLQLKNNNINIVGITWGSDNSRDVIYSQRICQQFSWEFVHFPITAETLHSNIQLAAKMGAEVSALHYHAMGQVAELKGIDVILAGSYGDSVGRAEFSGKHVTRLSSILPKKINRLGLIKAELFKEVHQYITEDAKLPKLYNVGENNLRKYEIEQEYHYMRRMLQSCMHVVAEKIPFYQMFTVPSVFGLMWGLNPDIRDNQWYTKLLEVLPGDLLQIPWARTGKLYHLPEGDGDSFDKRYHQYGSWLRTELKDEMLSVLNSSAIRELGIFNDYSLDALASNWKKMTGVGNNQLDEVVSWLASLNVFININQISHLGDDYKYTISDYYNSGKGACYGALYSFAKNTLNK